MSLAQVVVTNQITTHLPSKQSDWSTDEDVVVTASLGNTWAHCVNSRLMMEYAGGGKRKVNSPAVSVCVCPPIVSLTLHCSQLMVAKSPLCEGGSVMVTVGKEGLQVDSTSTGV